MSSTDLEQITYGNYRSIITGEDPAWQLGGFRLPDGSFWQYREPEATVIVEHNRLRVRAIPLTRRHDSVQVLDNAKHMYFSTRRFQPPEDGWIRLEWEMRARAYNGRPGDLYDGFVSVNLLDFETGLAIDFFACNEKIATVYARLRFPGVEVPDVEHPVKPKYWALFHELDVATTPGQPHRYAITYHRARDELAWAVDGAEVDRQRNLPVKMNGFLVALGLMTEKPLEDHGSVSLHGQGLAGEWSEFTITTGRGDVEC